MTRKLDNSNDDPIIALSEMNDDGTTDHQVGSMSSFQIAVTLDSETSIVSAERISDHFWSHSSTLPSSADIRASR